MTQVPDLDLAITTARYKGNIFIPHSGAAIHRVLMAIQSRNEGLRKHLVQLGRRQSLCVLPGSLKRMQTGVAVPMHLRDVILILAHRALLRATDSLQLDHREDTSLKSPCSREQY